MERVKEQLKLSLENKSGVVQTGELTVVLDGLVIEPESLASRSSSPTSKPLCVFSVRREKTEKRINTYFLSFLLFSRNTAEWRCLT